MTGTERIQEKHKRQDADFKEKIYIAKTTAEVIIAVFCAWLGLVVLFS